MNIITQIFLAAAAGGGFYAARVGYGHWRWNQYRKAVLRNGWFDPAITPSAQPQTASQSPSESTDTT